MKTETLILVVFMGVVGVILLFGLLAGSAGDDLDHFYTVRGRLKPLSGGLALAGDYVSAATLLSTTGAVALFGFDGFAVALGSLLATGVLFLLARPLRAAGRLTLGDVLAARVPGRAPRIAAALAALTVTLPYLVVQLAGAGVLTARLVGLDGAGAQQICTVLVGGVMVCFAWMAGMHGTNAVQILKVFVVLAALLVVASLVMRHASWNPAALLESAAEGSGRPADYAGPGLLRGTSATGRLDFVSLMVTIVLGAACMPHITLRLGCAVDPPTARRSARIAVGVVGVFLGLAVLLGLGAGAEVGHRAITGADPSGDSALLQLAHSLADGARTGPGAVLFTAVACAVFLTTLAVVSALAMAAAAALAHDLRAHGVRAGLLSETRELATARWAIALTGTAGIGLALAVQGSNVQFLATFAITVCASSLFPATVYALYRRRFDRAGALCCLYGGVIVAVVLQSFSPTVSGTPLSLFPERNFAWFPLSYPGLVSIPLGFALGWAGSRRGERRRHAKGEQAEQAEPVDMTGWS